MNFAEKLLLAEAAVRGAVKGAVYSSFGTPSNKVINVCTHSVKEVSIQYGKIKVVRKVLEERS